MQLDLKGTGVTATALCPGPVKTEFTDQHEGFDAAAAGTPEFIWMSAEDTASAGIKGLERGKRVVVPGVAQPAWRPGRPARSALGAARRRPALYPLGK